MDAGSNRDQSAPCVLRSSGSLLLPHRHQGQFQQQQVWGQHTACAGAASIPSAAQAQQHQHLLPSTNTAQAAPAPDLLTCQAQLVSSPLQGLCFSAPSSTSFDSNDSSSQHGPSSSSPDSRQGGLHPPACMGTAGLLCNSPCFSSDSMEMDLAGLSAQDAEGPASKRQCHRAVQDSHNQQQAVSGMSHHQLEVSAGQPAFALPSLHSMLGRGPATSKPMSAPQAAGAAAPAPAPPPYSNPWGGSSSEQQLHADDADQSSPFLSCSSQGAGEESPGSPPCSTTSLSPAAHTMPDPAAAPAVAAAAAHGSLQLVQRFLHACAAPAAVYALAVLAHNSLLPVQPVLKKGEHDEVSGPLAATLAHMLVLGTRGDVLRLLDGVQDATIIRTLLWMTESFFSQYRSSLKNAVYDYCCYTTGLPMDDPLVQDTLGEEVPDMIALQTRILDSSSFRFWVEEEQLLEAHKLLDAAGGLAAVQQQVACQLQRLQQWSQRNKAAAQLPEQQQHQHQQGLGNPGVEELPAAMQLFPGEVVTGMLVAEPTAPTAAAAHKARASFGAGSLHAQQQQDLQQQVQELQQRPALHDITSTSNMSALQPQDGAAKPHSTLTTGLTSQDKVPPQQQQQQQRRPRTRQQDKQQQQPAEHPAAPAAGTRRDAKTQLLQLASREQAVGSKRRREAAGVTAVAPQAGTAAAAAAEVGAGTQLQAQQRSGVVGGFRAGGGILRRMMQTAQSAVQSLGYRQ